MITAAYTNNLTGSAACRRALQVGDPTYRTIKGILVAGTEHDGQPQPDAAPTAPAHLHGPARLFNPDIANDDEGLA